MKRVLVSGFEAFGGETVNPTQRLIEALRAGEVPVPSAVRMETVLLPVGFKSAFDVLSSKIEEFKPDTVISLGLAGGRSAVELERVALNLIDASIADNDGAQPEDQPIVSEGPAAFFSTLPLKAMRASLNDLQIPARISNTAGLFVCNFVFYRLQALASGPGSPIKQSGFVHFPYLPEQTLSRPDAPAMEFQTMKRALEVLLKAIC